MRGCGEILLLINVLQRAYSFKEPSCLHQQERKEKGKAHSITAVIPSTGDSSTVFVLTADSLASSSPPLLLKMLLLLFLIQLLRKELLALI